MKTFLVLLLSCAACFGQADYTTLMVAAAPASAGGGSACDSINDASVIAYYSLDSVLTDSKNGYNLTDNGTVGYAAGKLGNGFSLTGSQWGSRASSAEFQTGDINFSCSFWFKVNSTASYGALVGKGAEWIVYVTDTAALTFLVRSGSGGGTTLTGPTISTGTWYHVVATCSASSGGLQTRQLIVNNGTPATTPSDIINTTSDAFAIGAVDLSGTWYWKLNGIVDEVLFTKKVLSAQEITDLYNSGSACRPSGL